jgi:hypothetical protein
MLADMARADGIFDVGGPVLVPRPVASSVDELLAGASHREPFLTSDSKSGSSFERVVIDGEPHIVKYVHVDDDWTMRMSGDIGNHPAQLWRAGLMDVLPERIDHAVVGVASGLGRHGWGAALLMRDVSDAMVPEGDSPLTPADHAQIVDDIAALSARMWGWRDDLGLVPLGNRYSWFNPACLEVERDKGWPVPVPKIAAEGWEKLAARVPASVLDPIDALHHDVAPLVDALDELPQTFVHGDWKLGNVGLGKDGRTVLIDWAYPGQAPCCYEIAWHVAVNRARIPESKEAAIERFRSGLEAHGVDTTGWFDRQIALCLLGGLLIFGWEKAYGDDDELGWWCDRAVEGARLL